MRFAKPPGTTTWSVSCGFTLNQMRERPPPQSSEDALAALAAHAFDSAVASSATGRDICRARALRADPRAASADRPWLDHDAVAAQLGRRTRRRSPGCPPVPRTRMD